MEPRTKAMILGGLFGAIFLGPGGAAAGAAMGGRIYDIRHSDDPPFEGEHSPNQPHA